MNIPLTKLYIDEEDLSAVQKPLQTGWLVQGPYTANFEKKMASYNNSLYAIATSSCTTALHLSLIGAQVKPGDTVIVPAFTYVATANAVEHSGAKPVFIDIDIHTYNLSVEHLTHYLENIQSPQKIPKAIIVVHLFGLCANMPEIMKLCQKYQITVIEDAACGLGAQIHGKAPGSFGLAACFSFHPRKIISTGEGGMILTNDKKTESLLRKLRDHGAEISDQKRHESHMFDLPEFKNLGYNYRMTDIQGALGCSQMKKISHILNKRKELAHYYDHLLEKLNWLHVPEVPSGYTHAYQSYVPLIIKINKNSTESGNVRQRLMSHLHQKGIASRPGTHAVPCLEYYKKKYNIHIEDYPNALNAHYQAITLPLYPEMKHQEIEYIANALQQFLRYI